MNTQQNTEQDIRMAMLNTFMSCPHRDTDLVKKIHEDLRAKDPSFYSHLACWYKSHGDIRDHLEIFAALLVTDPYLDNRETGLALFQTMPLFLKKRVLGFIKGKEVKIRVKTGAKKKIGNKMVDDVRIEKKTVGLLSNVPGSFKREVEKYLRWLENDAQRFDAAALKSFKDLKGLYASLKIRPSQRANRILFKKEYPDDSKMASLKKIVDAKTADEAAELIVKNKIPYTTAVGLVDQITPSIMVALIDSMSSQELLNNIASLKERGAFDNAQVKGLIEKKLEKAEKDKNVSALKSKTAVKTGRIQDEALIQKLDKIADIQIKKHGTVKVPTALLIDRSGSMNEAIEMGKHCAAMVSGATEAALHVVAFDSAPMPIVADGTTMTAWEKAFKPVHSGGNTSIGCGLKYLMAKDVTVDQVVIITDGGENENPRFFQVYEDYVKKVGTRPGVVIIRVGNYAPSFAADLTRRNIENEVYTPDAKDPYGLPGLIPLLAKTTKLDLLIEIMDTPLLKRKEYKDVAPYPTLANKGSRKIQIQS